MMKHKYLGVAVFFHLCAGTAIALQCYDTDNGKCGTGSRGSCVGIYMIGTNSSSGVRTKINKRLCDSGDCNTTQLCNKTATSSKLENLITCIVTCCQSNMCNTSPSPRTVPKTSSDVTDSGMTVSTATNSRLKCFRCASGINSDTCAKQEDIMQCELGETVCYSVMGNVASREAGKAVALRGCGTSSKHCNVTKLCLEASKRIFEATGDAIQDCTGYCCAGELCNRFNPTRPVNYERRTGIIAGSGDGAKDTIRRRTPATEKKVQPVRCHECIPENLGSLCHAQTREKVCPQDGNGRETNGCFTMSASVINITSGKEVDRGEWKDCSVTNSDCNVNSSRCDKLSEVLKDRGLALRDCYVNCCHGNMCNNFSPTPAPEPREARSAGQRIHAAKEFKLTAIASLVSMVAAWMKLVVL